jgi:hypothetical protein
VRGAAYSDGRPRDARRPLDDLIEHGREALGRPSWTNFGLTKMNDGTTRELRATRAWETVLCVKREQENTFIPSFHHAHLEFQLPELAEQPSERLRERLDRGRANPGAARLPRAAAPVFPARTRIMASFGCWFAPARVSYAPASAHEVLVLGHAEPALDRLRARAAAPRPRGGRST